MVFFVVLACDSDSDSDSDQDYSSTKQKISSYIEEGMDKYDIVGLSIALVDGDKTVWSEGFGYADKKTGFRLQRILFTCLAQFLRP